MANSFVKELTNFIRTPRIQEILRFCVAGGICFIVDYGLLFLCTEYLHINYLYSAAISFTVAVLLNYWLSLKFVFTNVSKQTTKQAVVFIGSGIVGLGINQVCMWLLVEKFAIYYMLAKIVSTIIVTVWNYVTKRWAVAGENKF